MPQGKEVNAEQLKQGERGHREVVVTSEKLRYKEEGHMEGGRFCSK